VIFEAVVFVVVVVVLVVLVVFDSILLTPAHGEPLPVITNPSGNLKY